MPATPATPVTADDDVLTVGFDLDMTLVDSSAGIATTVRAALTDVTGVPCTLSDAVIRPGIGLPLEHSLAVLAPDVDVAAVAARYRALYARLGVPGTTLLPGVTESLAAVRAVGGRVLVISAKAESGVRDVLAHVGLDRVGLAPDVVVGGLFAAGKGERLLVERADVYVGDHPGDVQAARVAGAAAVAVATGPVTAQDLVAAGADVVLDDLGEFPAWLSGYLRQNGRARTA